MIALTRKSRSTRAGLALFTFLGSILLANAGGLDGGGGNAVVCKNGKKIKSVELLDLNEARAIHGLKVKQSNEAYLKQALKLASDYSENSAAQALVSKDDLELVAEKMQFLPGASLSTLNDSNHIAVPKGCTVQQLAIYREGKLYINKDLWDRLNPTNRAALLFHEALYTKLRISKGEKDSLRTRHFVGALFSGVRLPAASPYENIHPALPGNPRAGGYLACGSDSLPVPGENKYAFNLYPLPGLGDRFLVQFLRINGEEVLTETQAVFSQMEAKGDNLRIKLNKSDYSEQQGAGLENLFEATPRGRQRVSRFSSIRLQAKSALGSRPIELTFERFRSNPNSQEANLSVSIQEIGTPRRSLISHCANFPAHPRNCCNP